MKKLLLLISLFLITATTASAAFWIIPQAGRKVTVNSAGVAKDKLTNGLVGWWTFDGGDMTSTVAFDKSGGGNTGTLTNGPKKTSGKIGQSLNFDNSNDVVVTNDFLDLNTAGDKITIGAWVKVDASPTTQDVVVSKFDNNSSQNKQAGWALRYSVNKIQFVLDRTGNCTETGLDSQTAYWASTDSFTDTGWHYLSVTHTAGSDSTIKVYYDGKEIAGSWTGTSNILLCNKTYPVIIGAIKFDGNYVQDMNGRIDDVRIYNRILSANEVYSLYKYGNAKINVASQAVANQGGTNGLVGHWTFNGADCGATWCADKSGSGNTGTLTGTKKVGGKIGQGLDFNGTSDYAQQGSNISFGDTVSITAWIKPDTLNRSNYIYSICDDANSACTGGDYATLSLAILSDNTLGALIAYSNTINRRMYMKSNSANLFTAGKWTHVAVSYTYSTNDLSLFVDGIRVALKPEGANCWTTGWVCVVGTGGETAFAARPAIGAFYNKYAGTFSSYFDGKIDDVRIYSRALSANEIYSLYMYGK